MANQFVRILILFLVVIIFRLTLGNPAEKYRQECELNSQSLRHLIGIFSELLEEKNDDLASPLNCDQLLKKMINYSSRIHIEHRDKMESFEKKFNETQEELLKEQQTNAGRLKGISEDLKQIYGDIYKQTSSKIKTLRQQAELELKNQAELGEKLDYYSLFLTSKFDVIDSNESCSLFNENGNTFISIADEILVALTGEMFGDNCERLSRKMMNLNSIIARSVTRNERRFELMKISFKARQQIVANIIHDNEEELRDFELLRDNATELQSFLDETIRINEKMKKEIEEEAFKFVIKMVQNDNTLLEARSTMKNLAKPEAYENILRKASKCENENLYSVVKFAKLCGGDGFQIILDSMINRQCLNHPVLLKLQKILKKEEMNEHVEKIYLGFSELIRNNSTNQVLNIIKRLTDDIVDMTKLIRLTYNRSVKNFLIVTRFIDAIDVFEPRINQNLESVFYNEMIEVNHVDTVEHVMFGFWLKKKFYQLDRQTTTTNEAFVKYKEQRDRLEELKRKLPEGIQNLFFEPYFIIANNDYTHLIRGFSYESVKFIAKPSDEGKYFRIEDTRDEMALFRASIDSKQGVMVGKADFREYYWQIVPTSNAQLFIIKNFVDGYAISSKEYGRCIKIQTNFFSSDECLQYEYYNLAFAPTRTKQNTLVYDESQKWKLTKILRRVGLLQDRTKRI